MEFFGDHSHWLQPGITYTGLIWEKSGLLGHPVPTYSYIFIAQPVTSHLISAMGFRRYSSNVQVTPVKGFRGGIQYSDYPDQPAFKLTISDRSVRIRRNGWEIAISCRWYGNSIILMSKPGQNPSFRIPCILNRVVLKNGIDILQKAVAKAVLLSHVYSEYTRFLL